MVFPTFPSFQLAPEGEHHGIWFLLSHSPTPNPSALACEGSIQVSNLIVCISLPLSLLTACFSSRASTVHRPNCFTTFCHYLVNLPRPVFGQITTLFGSHRCVTQLKPTATLSVSPFSFSFLSRVAGTSPYILARGLSGSSSHS